MPDYDLSFALMESPNIQPGDDNLNVLGLAKNWSSLALSYQMGVRWKPHVIKFQRSLESLRLIDPQSSALKEGFGWQARSDLVKLAPRNKGTRIEIWTSRFSSRCRAYSLTHDRTTTRDVNGSKDGSEPLPGLVMRDIFLENIGSYGVAGFSFYNDGSDLERETQVILQCK